MVIHFPIPPEDAVLLDMTCHNAVYCIDDWTRMRKIPLETAHNYLFDEEYIRVIGENTNMQDQNRILDRMLVYDQDDYLHAYSDLAQANASIWQYINLMNQNEIAGHYFPHYHSIQRSCLSIFQMSWQVSFHYLHRMVVTRTIGMRQSL